MPALVVVDRLPMPAPAVDGAGTMLLANDSFCDMIGSAMQRCDDTVTLNMFRDRTEELWVNSDTLEHWVSPTAGQPVGPGGPCVDTRYQAPVGRSWPV